MISTGINPVTGTFSWTPGVGDVGLHNLFVSVADDNCPITGMQGYAFLINVLAGTYAGPDINLCLGDTVQMQGDGGASFQWTPSTGLANDTLANTLAYPTVTTTYMLTSNFSGTCDTIDSMTINVVPAFTATFSSNQTICQGASVQLSASGSPAAAYSFQWSPGTGLDSTQVATPTASPTATTTYNVTITSPGSCMQLGSVVVTVDTAILNITPLASSNYICPGDNVTLYANVNASTSYTITWQDQDSVIVGNTDSIIVSPSTDMTYTAIITNGVCMEIASVDVTVSMLDIGADTISLCTGGSFPVNPVYAPIGSVPPTACGISTGCSGSGGITPYTVGNGTAVNSSTAYPAPFGNWYKNAKHQILYTAADLLAAGLTAGTITEIGFTVNTIIGTTLYSAYELKLGCTSVSSLSTWETGLNQVFSPTDVTITVGLNTLVLTSPFDWDGTSNLIMEICFDNLSTAYTNNSSSPYTVTGYNSVLYYRSDVTPACPFTGAATISVNRPNTTFTVCTEMFDPTFLWTPSAGVSNDTIANAILTPPASTVYKLTMNNGLCIITDSVYMALSDILGLSGTTQDATCGSADGTATVTIGGGTAPFAYLWNDVSAQTTGTAIGLGVGSYTVSITDSNGCTESLILSVSEAGGPSLTTTALDLNCSGGSAGEATVNATAGAPPYTYLWDDVSAQTNATATGLPAGTYTVIVTGSDNCMASTTVTITEPAPLSVVKSNTEPTCFGDCDGSATLTVNGGTAPFMYLWDDPSAQTNALASGLCDGTYQAIYTDANGCMDSTNVT
ncbi:MAG: SprB repeat-containing protein, partial [Flavobacteriales bacterium]|nr:SprB repeat-containing protein [Flavobacteriales bacterium]